MKHLDKKTLILLGSLIALVVIAFLVITFQSVKANAGAVDSSSEVISVSDSNSDSNSESEIDIDTSSSEAVESDSQAETDSTSSQGTSSVSETTSKPNTSVPTPKPVVTPAPTPVATPVPTPVPVPTCGTCGSTAHTTHPVEIPHYHGNGSDSGQCWCGQIYAPPALEVPLVPGGAGGDGEITGGDGNWEGRP